MKRLVPSIRLIRFICSESLRLIIPMICLIPTCPPFFVWRSESYSQFLSISAADDNHYEHPSKDTLTRLDSSTPVRRIYQTEQEATLEFQNPSHNECDLRLILPKDSYVSLKLYNIIGEEVCNLVTRFLYAGSYKIRVSCSRLSSGVYFVRLETQAETVVRKLVIIHDQLPAQHND